MYGKDVALMLLRLKQVRIFLTTLGNIITLFIMLRTGGY
jgi:hypothetical protein